MIDIVKPKVYLIGYMKVQEGELLDFLENNNLKWETDVKNGEKLVECGGRLCYLSFGKGRKTNKEFIDNILNHKHGSVLEHAVFSFIIEGVSRSLTHELVRHRHLSYSQLSQRYVNEELTGFVQPQNLPPYHKDVWERLLTAAQTAYSILNSTESLLRNTTMVKKAREIARSVLPNATETKIMVTGNARAWRHFIEIRGSEHAEPEIREVAFLIWNKLKDIAPNLFGDYKFTGNIVSTSTPGV